MSHTLVQLSGLYSPLAQDSEGSVVWVEEGHIGTSSLGCGGGSAEANHGKTPDPRKRVWINPGPKHNTPPRLCLKWCFLGFS